VASRPGGTAERTVAENTATQMLDPQSLSKLKGLDLVAKLVVEGFLTGLHKSPYHGFSVEFAEHRQYMPGDPLKHVDWKLFGKSDRFYVKIFEEETNLRAHVLMDVSASMGYASEKRVTKYQYASFLAAGLAYLLVMQNDAVGLLTFRDEVVRMIPPRSSQGHLKVLLQELENTKPAAATATGKCLESLAERVKRRGLILLLTDLMDEPASVMRALKHFRHRQHEVVVFHILDPWEIEFPFRSESGFVDLETGQELLTQPWEIAEEYRKRVKDWTQAYQRLCLENRIEYVQLATDTPFDRALLRYLEKRRRLH
jgi:uncharacterized protein (DUF58 family)